MERALLNSGKVDFVATKSEREQLRDEKADMGENASVYTAKSMGEETGADLMLIGTINTIVDQEGNKAVVFYQTNLELVEIESNRKVWIGEKKIKKYVERAKTRF
jgi:PBP1b-binding outer membrane lipoprotein LpoB